MTRIGVVTFPGSLDERDAARAIRLAGATPVVLWHGDCDLQGVDALILPGGFSYGDYVRAGAIARFSPVMGEVIRAAKTGMPIFGICNGFQMLTEAGLLPGALARNTTGRFVCRDQELRVASNDSAWTNAFERNERITIPLKSGEGRFVASTEEISRLFDEDRVVCTYTSANTPLEHRTDTHRGRDADANPNGSLGAIAGVCNTARNVVGLMPHPEHAVEPGFGPDTSRAMRSGTDGLRFLTSVIESSTW